ncbi:MAG TPA: isoprenylcysteine carboxylmethyltransferase family protein [Blastocatellia bacterium]|nr:isoprenylcysteine carboxylmethyltransferase family protein [Blastocatellia bacterium]
MKTELAERELSRVKAFEKTKLYDLAASVPLVVFYGWGVWTISLDVAGRFQALADGGSPLGIIGIVSQALTVLVSGVLLTLLLARRVPKAKASGLMPRFAAVMGTFAGVTFSFIPLAPLPLFVSIITMAPVIVGTLATIIVALWLGRQFSIMPEARRLVVAGPYARVRHPLYLCEEIALFGIALQHLLPWALIVFACQFTLQLVRMRYEEEVLTSAFPEYTAYAARTPRLIPGIY